MSNPTVGEFTAERFAEYRTMRLKSGIKAETVNREHAYLRGVFNELRRLGMFKRENPLSSLRQVKTPERELSFLTLEQIESLLKALEARRSGDALLVTRLCLSTGARWSEAETLRPSQLRGGAVHFSNTKSGKNRSVPIGPEMAETLNAHLVERYGDGAKMANRYFHACMGAFRQAVKTAGLVLPEGQSTHVLRHTFASHFMMNGGNILVLQKILGHASLVMTMRYAHLAPDHLQEAVSLNPLASVRKREEEASQNGKNASRNGKG